MGHPAEALEPRTVVAEAPVAVPGFSRGLLVAMRPPQWVKNLFVLAGVVFAGKVADRHALLQAAIAFAAFCAASSAAYLVNDVRDAASDRLHPLKRDRPIAAGALAHPSRSRRRRPLPPSRSEPPRSSAGACCSQSPSS